MRPLCFHKNWHEKFNGSFSDEMRQIQLEILFQLIFVDLPHPTVYVFNKELTEENYITDRTKMMKFFGYDTISIILKDIDLIQYNIRWYNEEYLQRIKPSQRPTELSYISTEETNKIVIWSAHLMQNFVQHNLAYKPPSSIRCPDTYTKTKPIIEEDDHNYGSKIPEPKDPPQQVPPTIVAPTILPDKTKSTDEHCFLMKCLKWNIEQSTNKNVAYSMVSQKNMWIGDSGVFCHFTNDDSSFILWHSINDEIGVGNNDIAIATKQGTL
jgi:hypothetical protein